MLASILFDAGLFTGSPLLCRTQKEAERRNMWVNNSSLSDIKALLTAGFMFQGDEHYLTFGSEFHIWTLLKRHLTKAEGFNKLTPEDLKAIQYMAKAFWKDGRVQKLMDETERELMSWRVLNGVWVRGTIDAKNVRRTKRRRGIDLKSTSCRSEEEFIHTALQKYDYLRQGKVYEWLEDFDEFYFIGVQKKPPYGVFILDVNNYQKEKDIATNEAVFLLEFFEHNGKPILK